MCHLKRVALFLTFVLTAVLGPTGYAAAEQRLALVIGQGAYETGQLPTAVNDAGLVAQALTSAGFEVIQGRDASSNDLRRIVRDFLDKAQTLERGSAVVVYLSGHGLQLEGDNYLLPVDARIQRDADVPLEGFRLSDLIRSLGDTPAQTRVVIADMARDYPLPSGGQTFAKGLALVEPPPGFLIAFSSAPNITAPDGQGPYGAYATALVEMMRQPGLRLDDVFARVRLRTHEATNGLQTPWHAADLGNSTFVFFEPAETASAQPPPAHEERRIAAVPAEEAYGIAVERDTIQDYQEFLRRYPDHPLARRVTALLAARREALVWRKTVARNTSEAYWTYLRRYPNGPHAPDCRRRLTRLAAPLAPPPVFEEVIYEDLPPPLPVVETIEVVDVVTIIREAPPPPPPPIYLLPARDYDDEVVVTVVSAPPPPPPMVGILPIPVPIPIPVRARPPVAFYEPIAPVTPRGMVAIPVAPPPIQAAPPPVGPGGQRPRLERAPQPAVPTLPDQPGLAAPIQTLPVAARAAPAPGAVAPIPARPGSAAAAPRLPTRPIPLLGTQSRQAQPGTAAVQPEAPAQPRAPAPIPVPASPAAPGQPAARVPTPEAPVSDRRPSATVPGERPSTVPTPAGPAMRQPVAPSGEARRGRDRRQNQGPPAGAKMQMPPGTPPEGARMPGAPRIERGEALRRGRVPTEAEARREIRPIPAERAGRPDLGPRPPSARVPVESRAIPGPSDRPGRPSRLPQEENHPMAGPRPVRPPALERQGPREGRPAFREERARPAPPQLRPPMERPVPPAVQERAARELQPARPMRPERFERPEPPRAAPMAPPAVAQPRPPAPPQIQAPQQARPERPRPPAGAAERPDRKSQRCVLPNGQPCPH